MSDEQMRNEQGVKREANETIDAVALADAVQQIADVVLGSSEICFALAEAKPEDDGAYALLLVARALEDAGMRAVKLAKSLEK